MNKGLQKIILSRQLAYGLAAFLVLATAFWIIYSNYRIQIKVRENSIQHAKIEFMSDSHSLGGFLLERQGDLRNLAQDQTIAGHLASKSRGKYFQNNRLRKIRRKLSNFQQHKVIVTKTIFPKLLLLDVNGQKLVELVSDEFKKTSTPSIVLDLASASVLQSISHDPHNPNYLRFSVPCTYKKNVVGRLIAWTPYSILFEQYLFTSLPKDLEHFFFIFKQNVIPSSDEFSEIKNDPKFSQKIQEAIDGKLSTYQCPITQEPFILFIDQPAWLPFKIVKLISRRELVGTNSPAILFIAMMTLFSLFFVSMILFIQLSLKQRVNAVRLADALERHLYMEQKNTELETANKNILISRQEAVRERERLNVTLRSIGDAVITIDLDENIVLINRVGEELTGWCQEEAAGKPLPDVFRIINEKTGAICESPVKKTIESGKIMGLANNTALIARDGTQRSIADSAAPILDPEGKIVGVVLVFRDVTEQKKTEEEILKIKKLESVGVLAGGIAHDFNNLLTSILGNIDIARTYLDSGSEAYTLLGKAEKSSLQAKKLTKQLLTFSKGGDPVKRTTSIQRTIIESVDFVLHGTSVNCRFSIPEDLWLVDIDTGQMSQVIQNIVINSFQSMPGGGKITIGCHNIPDITKESGINLPGDRYIKITIQDMGTGIDPKYQDKIFDPYFSTKPEGSGLGLSVTHSIITKHNGHITVRSKPDVGTIVTIYLPAIENSDVDQETAPIAVRPANDKKAKVLIMDDEKAIRDVAQLMLSRLGHEVIKAKDGEETIALFQQYYDSDKPFDLIIMDLTIPGGMGGKDAVREILKIAPDTRVVVSSGYSNDPVLADFQDYGFTAAIGKPFSLSELNSVIQTVLM